MAIQIESANINEALRLRELRLRADLKDFSQTKSALHFDKPLPKTLVRKLMNQRQVQIMIKKKRK